MVEWRNPDVITYVFFLYEQISVILLGFYGCVSLPCAPLFHVSRNLMRRRHGNAGPTS